MKKSILVLSALLCFSIALQCNAQPATPTSGQWLNIGKRNILNKDYVKAEANARRSLFLAIAPEDKGDALMLLGQTFYKRKMYDQARAYWGRVAALDDPEGELGMRAHAAFASSYLAEGHADKAIAEYKIGLVALNTKPGVDQDTKNALSFLLGNTYYRNRQFELAKAQFQGILRSTQGDSNFIPLALFRLSNIDVFQEDIQSAVSNLAELSNLKRVPAILNEYAQTRIKYLTSAASIEEKVQSSAKGDAASDALDAAIDNLTNSLV